MSSPAPCWVGPDLGRWLALRRVLRGGVVQFGRDAFIARGRPVPDYIACYLAILLADGHIRCGRPQEATGCLPLLATSEGETLHDALEDEYRQRLRANRSNMARVTVKHATASVFLVARADDSWHIGLIRHPRLGRWVLPGGHIEPNENPAEAALREVTEETGLPARLLPGPGLDEPDGASEPPVIAPLWIVEQQVPAERREPGPHVHVDHLYLALTELTGPAPGAELPFVWYAADELAAVEMFADTRARAAYLLDRIDTLAQTSAYDRVPGTPP